MLRVGLIGAGFIGNAHAEAYKKIKDIVLVCNVEKDENKGKELAEKYCCTYYKDAEAMFIAEEIDIVDICLPTFLHEKYALLAARNKKHIICEKPFALTLESAGKMKDAAQANGVKLMIAQVIRYWPEYVKIKEYLESGMIGNVKMIYASRLSQHPNWTDWHKDANKGGGGLFDLHLHDIDLLFSYFGEVESVYAIGNKSQNECWNYITTSLKFKNGVNAAVECSSDITGDYPFSMLFRIVGDHATIDYKLIAGHNLESVDEAIRSTTLYQKDGAQEKLQIDKYDAYQKELKCFGDYVAKDDERNIVRIEDSIEVLKIIVAIKQSLETGDIVMLREKPGVVVLSNLSF